MNFATGLTLAAGAALLLGVSGCDKKDEAPKAAAGGQLLPRSVGDEMIPYDTLRSQAPLKNPDAGLGGGDGGSSPSAAASDAAEENADVIVPATPSPSASPEAAAE